EATAASKNDDISGASTTPHTRNAVARDNVSKRDGASLNLRTPSPAIAASLQLVTKNARTSGHGQVPSSTSRCAGNTEANTSGQRRGGVNNSAVVRIAFGGHTTEGTVSGMRRTNPTCAP